MNKNKLIDGLDSMLQANPRNSRKNAQVMQWFDDEVSETGRSSVVSEDKQAGNRISEQFNHKSSHVIFVYHDEQTKKTLLRRIFEFKYKELKTVLLLKDESSQVDFSLPSDLIVFDVHSALIDWYKQNLSDLSVIENDSTSESKYPSSNINAVLLPKPFLLLAGISGTGKTRFVREQAAAHNVGDKNFCLVPVRPDWHEPSDLLGYISRIGGKPEYVSTKVLQFVVDAWKSVAPNANSNGMGSLNLVGVPYWLCLDEMNLAPVEQYFSDYLSVLESRKFSDCVYTCDPLLDKSVLETEGADIQKDLKLSDHQELWDFFCINGISLPPNLIVAGTVNMDETTHGFSRKVIDRALSIDFGEFFPNDYSKFFKGQAIPKTLTYSAQVHVSEDTFKCASDSDGSKTVAFLEEINGVLRNTPFELAYRALNELLLYVNTFEPDSDEKLQAVWDDFLMTKVLPRIDGDDDKLRIIVDGKSFNLLEKLEVVLAKQFDLIWGEDKKRVDLLRDDEHRVEINDILCRSKKKIKWMRNRLEINTFTSYWP